MAIINDQLKKFKEALADIIVSSQGLCTYDACKDVAERETTYLISMLLPEQNIQSSNIKETIRAEIERKQRIARYQWRPQSEQLCQELLDWLDALPDEPNHLEEALELVAEYNLKPYRDGNAWCILLGKDIQSGICGFGDTLTKTYLDFLKSYKEYKHPIGELLNNITEQSEN